MGIMGIDTDPALLARLGVEVRDGVRFDEVVGLLGKARFAPVFHRPLFRHLGFVTNRTFETFYADTLPVLMLPRDFVAAIYGEAALTLVPGDDVAAHLDDALNAARNLLGGRAPNPVASGPSTTPMPGGSRSSAALASRARVRGRAVNVLFVMKHRGDAGNTHAVANYMRLAPKYGHSVAIFGTPIWYVPELQFSTDIRSFDRVIYVYESELYRIKRMHEAVHARPGFRRQHRLILDTDGMYNPVVTIDGYDFNHRNEAERARWIDHLDALGDKVMQTTIARPSIRAAGAMTFYGYNPALQLDPSTSPPKQYDILHLGHNWWRWREVSRELLPAIEQIRDADRPASPSSACGGMRRRPRDRQRAPRRRSTSDPEGCAGLRIETPKAVMYHDVIQTMSTARINIMTQRPVLRHLKHLTLKYFEIFCADTIPLLMLDADHAEAVYGPAGRELSLPGAVAEQAARCPAPPRPLPGRRRGRPPASRRALLLRPAGRGAFRRAAELRPPCRQRSQAR